jgi:hypothetical protein
MLALLIVATIVDLALAALLIAVSGFVIGGGPESAHGDPFGVAMWAGSLTGCLAAPVAGFVLRAYGKASAAAVLAWLPPLAALLVTAGLIPGV